MHHHRKPNQSPSRENVRFLHMVHCLSHSGNGISLSYFSTIAGNCGEEHFSWLASFCTSGWTVTATCSGVLRGTQSAPANPSRHLPITCTPRTLIDEFKRRYQREKQNQLIPGSQKQSLSLGRTHLHTLGPIDIYIYFHFFSFAKVG